MDSLATALRARPGRYLRSVWPWRSLAWCAQGAAAAGCVYGLGAAVVLPPLGGTWDLRTPGGLALEALMVALLLAVAAIVGWWQRHAVRIVGYRPIAAGYPWGPRDRGATARALALDVVCGLATFPVTAVGGALALTSWFLPPLCVVAFGGALVRPDLSTLGPWWTAPGLLLSLMITAIVPWLWGWVALAGVRLCRRVSDPRGDAARRQAVERQAASVRLADAFAADRRRIERDLHDGAQQRIVAQSLTLGRAAAALDPGTGAADPARARDLVAHALDENRAILADLRALVRSISPRVLLDRGVGAAVAEVAARAGLPVEVDVRLPERLPALVEQTAYFVVLEALTNATKHADATGVRVRVTRAEDELLLEVRDDGAGGARIVEDGGLAGLIDRVRGIGGTVHLTSPPGSGTRVSARLPLVLPRTARTELARWSA